MPFDEYSGPPICGPPFYKATISENNLCIFVSNLPLTRGHPSNKARFSIPQGWPYERGTTVLHFFISISVWATFGNLMNTKMFCCWSQLPYVYIYQGD